MIQINNISKSFGDKYIFKDFSLHINLTDKIGIVGKNGVGKTTLIKCITDPDFLNSGDINTHNYSIGYLKQGIFSNENNTVFQELISLYPELIRISEKLEDYENNNNENYDEYIKLQDKFNNMDGYNIKIKFERFLTGFSFEKDDLYRKLSSFSGGEKTKIMLIKILLQDNDYLILDEPTNHLDINAIEWLEKYLIKHNKGLILISHDQVFLNNVCNKILEMNGHNIKLYNTNFDNYLIQREYDYELELKTYINQKKIIKKYEEFIIRNNKKPSKISQVNDRKKKLEKLQLLEKPIKFSQKLNFKFESLPLKRSTYIEIYQGNVEIDNNKLIENINLKIFGGERYFIVGKNGVGKTTLIKNILNNKMQKGKIKIPSAIKIGYLDQEHKILDNSKNIYDFLYDTKKFTSQTALRKYLANFLFIKNDIYKSIDKLSGGERVRLSLAYIALEKYDLLIMDEPTNHLDFETKFILQEVLKNFPGSLLIISHDRKLINSLSTHILEIENKKASTFKGNWNEFLIYKEKINLLNMEKKKQEKEQSIKNSNKKTYKNTNKPKKINQQKLNILEENIFNLEAEKEILTEELTTKENFTEIKQLSDQLTEIEKKLAIEYTKYNELIGE